MSREFSVGDRVRLGTSRGVVRQCHTVTGGTTMRDGRPYLRVYITQGPRAGSWDWPDRWRLEQVSEDTRPIETSEPRMMLNNCQRCGRYKYVLCMRSGKWSYLCGRCRRDVQDEARPVVDASGRVIAPPQSEIPERPRGPWDANHDAVEHQKKPSA